MKKPFSDNIVFLDTEFTDLDIRKGQLLSVGMVKLGGEELYIEIEYEGKVNPWVKKHVLPCLTGKKVSPAKARQLIRRFIGKEEPYLVAYVNQFDAVYWYRLFGSAKKHPAFWIPIDFASILFSYGFAPNSLGKHRFFEMLGIKKDKYKEHNALGDAKMLRDIYLKFFEYLKGECL